MQNGEVLMGNGAVARGLIEAGCHGVFGYPGTPSSEIMPEIVRFKKKEKLNIYTEWSVNEKVALEAALAFAWTGKRAAVVMKQVGLNVACDPLMSAAYTGTTGGFLVISCDDPGPHSSQTEQDSRVHAMFAKLPVLDPSTPDEARAMARYGLELSEKHGIPVILRPSIRICHARQWIPFVRPESLERPAAFKKNPERWAATPKFRLTLHHELNDKLDLIAKEEAAAGKWNCREGAEKGPLGIVAAGPTLAHLYDIMRESDLTIPLLTVGLPHPIDYTVLDRFGESYDKVLVLEEPEDAIESQFTDRTRILGRRSGHVPSAGELTPEKVNEIVEHVLAECGLKEKASIDSAVGDPVAEAVNKLEKTVRRPTLCPGCPHRSSFFAIRKALPRAIYTSDIGCYTLGLNLRAVDTILCMGGAVSMASGFWHAHNQDAGEPRTVVATIGDSTFYHSGLSGLVSAIYTDARFVLVILDNAITAMTGMQPTPGIGVLADGTKGRTIPLEEVVKGAGVEFLEVVDAYDHDTLKETLLAAQNHILQPDGRVAVIISRAPCLIHEKTARHQWKGNHVAIDPEECEGCGVCVKTFECPALIQDEPKAKVHIDRSVCVDCGNCTVSCRQDAIMIGGNGK